jgi:hypothetical protein
MPAGVQSPAKDIRQERLDDLLPPQAVITTLHLQQIRTPQSIYQSDYCAGPDRNEQSALL